MKNMYHQLTKQSLKLGVVQLKQAPDHYEFNEYFLKLLQWVDPTQAVSGLGATGKSQESILWWLLRRNIVTLEFLINEGLINDYDCNIPSYQEDVFSQHIQSVMRLQPRFLEEEEEEKEESAHTRVIGFGCFLSFQVIRILYKLGQSVKKVGSLLEMVRNH